MTTEVKTLVDDINRNFNEFKVANDKKFADTAENLNKAISATEEKLADLETALNRAGTIDRAKAAMEFVTSKAGLKELSKVDAKNNPFLDFMAKDGAGKFDTKTVTALAGTNADGGYTIPTIIQQIVDMQVVESSPIEQMAKVTTLNGAGNQFNGTIDNNDASAGWVAETGSRTQTNANTFTRVTINTWELYANPRISLQLIEDSQIDAQSELLSATGAILARSRATGFVNGTGDSNQQPSGFLNTTVYSTNSVTGGAAPVIGDINYVTGLGTGGTAQTILSDDVYNLVYSLRDQFMAKGEFAANRLVIEALRKLKDSYGRYMWEPNVQAGQPATLVGYPIKAFADMTSTLTVTGGAYALTFADWSNFYRIVQKTGLQVLRDPYSAEGYVIFKTRQRVGGGIYNGFAGSTLKVQQS